MNIEKFIELAANRLATLNAALATAVALGQLDEIARLDIEIAEVETILSKLRSLL